MIYGLRGYSLSVKTDGESELSLGEENNKDRRQISRKDETIFKLVDTINTNHRNTPDRLTTIYYFFAHVEGENASRSGNISKRPSSMAMDSTVFESAEYP